MIKIQNIDGSNNEQGYKTIKEIIYARLDKKLVDNDALNLLIKKTGGVLRHCFQAIQKASAANSALEKQQIGIKQIEYGLNDLEYNLWMEVNPGHKLPASEQITLEDLNKKLAEYYEIQEQGKRIRPASDTTDKILLMSSALIEYINGKKRFIVHPILNEGIKTSKWYKCPTAPKK